MRTWNFAIRIDPEASVPLYRQIARAVIAAIKSQRLKPGDPIPSSRALAEDLAINRQTVATAYKDLALEGWIETRHGGGSFVSQDVPGDLQTPVAKGLGFALTSAGAPAPSLPAAATRETMTAATGVPDLRLLPMAALSQAYHRAIRAGGGASQHEGHAQGHPRLRETLAEMLASTRSLRASAENTFITSGSQMAFYLLAQVLCSPGDRIIVESPGDPRVWSVFREAGADVVPVRVDDDGLDVPLIEAGLDPGSIRAIYLTPQRQYPTTVALSRARRAQLLELARRHRFAIIEHDEDAELQYEGPLPLPLAAEDETGCVIHVGTLSKLFSPGTRLGFIHAPEDLIPHLIQRRLLVDRQGDQVLELAMADLLRDGELVRHLKRMRRTCLERRNILLDTLQGALGAHLQVIAPSGGMALWIQCPGRDADAWAAEALKRRILVAPASRFIFPGEAVPQAIRLGFASYDGPELRLLTKGLAVAWRKLES